VRNNGEMLKYGSSEIKNNMSIITLAIRNKGDSLKYAGEKFKEDQELVWISKRYFKRIRQIEKCLDLNFTF
jgi:hypothetical protein